MKKTKPNKFLGVWMNESEAHLIELSEKDTAIKTIESGYHSRERVAGESPDGNRVGHYRSSNNEYSKHKRKEEYQAQYLKEIFDSLKGYDEILLFGPTRAKNRLFNMLEADKSFAKVNIHVVVEDDMTKNQMKSYVKKYFRNLYELQKL